MAAVDLLAELDAFIARRMDGAEGDKAAFEHEGARLNSQLMQGELNMGAAVLAWLERRRSGGEAAGDAEDEDAEDGP